MNKTLTLVVTAIAVLVVGFFLFNSYIYNQKQGEGPASDYKNASYVINGEVITLKNGLAETEIAPGSASKLVTKYFGNEVIHDFDHDGREDVAFLLTQEGGGSGTFFYVVAALNRESGYIGSQGLLLGDRIAPQTTDMGDGDIIVVNYADRASGEDFSVQPSVGKSIWLFLDTDAMQFGEVAKDFEGEADPSRMTLGMKSWTWVSALYSDGREIKPTQSLAFTIDFNDDGSFSATTDCNRVAGSYTAKNSQITFSDMISTLMYCEGSQESVFTKLLEDAAGFHFTSAGKFILDLKFDSGTATFR